MKKCLLVLGWFVFSHTVAAQPDCHSLHALLDTIAQLNKQRLALGNDTPAIKKLFLDSYKPLRLYYEPGIITWDYIHFDIGMENLDRVHQCLSEWAAKYNWFTERHAQDETGFRKFSVYDTEEKKNSILFYRNYHNSIAHRETKKHKFNLAVSLRR